jgi:DNA processing protein
MLATTLSREEELLWLALRLIPGLGTRKAGQLIERFGTPRAVFRASRSELEDAGIGGGVAQSICSGCSFDDAVAQQQKLLQTDTTAIVISEPRYPPKLREIFDPPILMFARGRIELLDSLMLGIVGTRRPTPYGMAVSERLAADLALAGLTIVSGMARGIDTAAHKGALSVSGDTVAVLGCGVDIVYPSENRRLADQLSGRGLLLSEFPMGAPAFPQNFPIRNRIISGMSAGVVVVEGSQYSGSSITARLALDQGREVFAVPGNITSKMSWGPNLLIKQGAKLVQDWNDVVVELPVEDRRRLVLRSENYSQNEGDTACSETSGQERASMSSEGLSELGRRILGQLKVDTAIHIDEILEKEEHSTSSELIATLFELEMLGLVRQLPGKNFVKVW